MKLETTCTPVDDLFLYYVNGSFSEKINNSQSRTQRPSFKIVNMRAGVHVKIACYKFHVQLILKLIINKIEQKGFPEKRTDLLKLTERTVLIKSLIKWTLS